MGWPVFHSRGHQPTTGSPLASDGSGYGKETAERRLFLFFSLLPHWSPVSSTVLRRPKRLHLIFFLYLISNWNPRHKAVKTRLTYTQAPPSGSFRGCSALPLRQTLQPSSCRRFRTTEEPNPERDWLAMEQLSKLSRLETGVGSESRLGDSPLLIQYNT